MARAGQAPVPCGWEPTSSTAVGGRVAGGRGGLASIPGPTARPPSRAGCPLPAPVTSRGRQQWAMTERQVPRWCPCPRPPPSAAPQKDRPWHKAGEGEDAAHGPSGSRRYFPIQGNICSCFSFQSRAGSRPRTGSPALHWAGRWGPGLSPEPLFSALLPPPHYRLFCLSRDSWPGACASRPPPPPARRCPRLSLPTPRYRGSWGKHGSLPWSAICVY